MDVGRGAVEPHGDGLTLDDLGPDDARADRIDPDVVGRQVHGHAPRHAEDGRLGRVVGHVVRLGDERGDRGQVDDRAPAGLLDRRHDVLGDEGRPHDVDVENVPPFLGGRLDAAEDEDRRVVDEDVDRAEGAHGLGRHPRHARLVGNIGADEEGLAAGLLDPIGGIPSRRLVLARRSTTAAPSSANSSAVARPIPAPAPVITATFPFSRFMTVSSAVAQARFRWTTPVSAHRSDYD